MRADSRQKQMTDKVDTGASPLDTVKLAAAVAILLGGVAGFYLLTSYPLAVRWVIVLASLAAGVFVALQSAQGRTFWQFVQGSRVELRKVVWPTRQEAIRLTWIVIIAVIIISLMLAGFDQVIQWLIRLVLRQ